MSNPAKKKKVVITTSAPAKAPVKAKRSGTIGSKSNAVPIDLVFGKINFIWMVGGVVLIAIGLILMSGGEMPSADVWDDNLIYSSRRIVLAPVVILLGLIVEILAIFKIATQAKEEV